MRHHLDESKTASAPLKMILHHCGDPKERNRDRATLLQLDFRTYERRLGLFHKIRHNIGVIYLRCFF